MRQDNWAIIFKMKIQSVEDVDVGESSMTNCHDFNLFILVNYFIFLTKTDSNS